MMRRDWKGIWDSGMRGIVAIQNFMGKQTQENKKISHLVYIFPVPEYYLITQGEIRSPKTAPPDYPLLLS